MPKQDASEVLMLKLKPLLKEWQKRLRIEHWVIDLEIDNEIEAYAQSCCTLYLLQATISIRNPKTHPKEWKSSADCNVEVSLVHELLHVRNASFEPVVRPNKKDKASKVVWNHYESSIDMTAQALVAAKYGLPK